MGTREQFAEWAEYKMRKTAPVRLVPPKEGSDSPRVQFAEIVKKMFNGDLYGEKAPDDSNSWLLY